MRVTKDAPVRREQVHPGSVMLKGNARLPQPEPVRTRIPDGLKFSPFSSRRKIPSEAKSEGGENIRVKKTHDFSEVGPFVEKASRVLLTWGGTRWWLGVVWQWLRGELLE